MAVGRPFLPEQVVFLSIAHFAHSICFVDCSCFCAFAHLFCCAERCSISPHVPHTHAARIFSEVSTALRRAQEASTELSARLRATEAAQVIRCRFGGQNAESMDTVRRKIHSRSRPRASNAIDQLRHLSECRSCLLRGWSCLS